jgi:hypothetical protein
MVYLRYVIVNTLHIGDNKDDDDDDNNNNNNALTGVYFPTHSVLQTKKILNSQCI